MKTYSNIQKYFWSIANYDSFLLQFCPTFFNSAAGIGVYFLLQLVIVFITIFITYQNLFSSYLFIGILLATIVTFGYYKWVKFSTKKHHQYPKIEILFIQSFISLLTAFVLTVPICVSLFKSEVSFQLLLETGKQEFLLLENIWVQPYGLYLSCCAENSGIVIISFCVAILLFLFFILFIPYLLILQNRKSIYNTIKTSYEQNFHNKKLLF